MINRAACKQQPDLVLNEAEAAELLQVSRETVRRRQRRLRLIAFRGIDGSLGFPAFSVSPRQAVLRTTG